MARRRVGGEDGTDWRRRPGKSSEVRVRGRERAGLGLVSVYGTEVSERAGSAQPQPASPLVAWSGVQQPHPHTRVNCMNALTHTHARLSPVEQAPIVSRAGFVFTCVGICVFVVTGAVNSTVLAQPDRQVLRGPACSLTRSLSC